MLKNYYAMTVVSFYVFFFFFLFFFFFDFPRNEKTFSNKALATAVAALRFTASNICDGFFMFRGHVFSEIFLSFKNSASSLLVF